MTHGRRPTSKNSWITSNTLPTVNTNVFCENKHRMLSHDICDTHQQATVPLRVLLSALSLFSLRHCLTFIDPPSS